MHLYLYIFVCAHLHTFTHITDVCLPHFCRKWIKAASTTMSSSNIILKTHEITVVFRISLIERWALNVIAATLDPHISKSKVILKGNRKSVVTSGWAQRRGILLYLRAFHHHHPLDSHRRELSFPTHPHDSKSHHSHDPRLHHTVCTPRRHSMFQEENGFHAADPHPETDTT